MKAQIAHLKKKETQWKEQEEELKKIDTSEEPYKTENRLRGARGDIPPVVR